ncbi:MAG: hypothetical protein J6D31_08945 [Clostridia bacterium]|nr:hypothetical protein [Clostridia bacterium]
MKKRLTSLLLALVMVLLCVPTWVMPAAAAEAADTEKPVYVRFRLADAREYGYTGTVVSETAQAPGFASIVYPTDLQLLSYGVKPSDVLGWYHIQPDGTFVDASAYNGVYISEDLNFYPYLKFSSMSFNSPANVPVLGEAGSNKILALRGGWNAGVYRNGEFVNFDYAPTPGLVSEKGSGSAWSAGGAYYRSGGGGSAVVLSTNANRVLGLSWTALAAGTVKANIDKVSFRYQSDLDKPVNAQVYLAIAKNDVIVWPAAAKDSAVVTTDFAAGNWYAASLGNTAALAASTDLKVAALTDSITVEAGDTIRFYFGYSNHRPLDAVVSVGYETVGSLSEEVVYSLPNAYEPAKPLDASQAPVLGAVSDTEPEVSYPGSWSMIVYDDKASIANSDNANEANYYTKVGSADSFITAHKDYGTAGACPSQFQNKELTSNWGAKYSIGVKYEGTNGAATDAAGFRYTAEHAGYIKPSFDALSKHMLGWEQGAATYNGTRIAIFVDGVMAWPNAGADATDLTKWYQPYTVEEGYKLPKSTEPDPSLADMADEVNALLENVSIYVQQGSHVDFLLTYAESVSIYGGSGNVVKPAVIYSEVFSTDFSAYATIGDSLALDFVSDASGFSFQPSEKKPYLLADTLQLSLSCEAAGIHVGTPTLAGGQLVAKVSNIMAKQMTEPVNYRLTATAKCPDNSEKQLVLNEGSVSVASYMKALYTSTTETVLRDLALGTLQYGAAAQTYFGYKTDDLATAGLSGKVSFTLPEVTDKIAKSGSGDYAFTGATLLLEDTLKLKLLLQATDAPLADWASCYLAVNGKRTDATIALNDGSTDGGKLKAVLSVPFSEFSTDYVLTLHAAGGTQVSDTLTYSVETYAARMGGVTEQAAVLDAIRTVGVAAANYKAMYTPTDDGEIVTRLVFLSDAHIGETFTKASDKLTSQLAQIKEWNNTTPVDAILFPGDVTNLGINSEYTELHRIITEAALPESIKLSFVIGNHEFSAGTDGTKGAYTDKPAAEAITWAFQSFNNNIVSKYHDSSYTLNNDGEGLASNGIDHAFTLNGVRIIGLSMRGGGATYGELTEKFLVEQVKAAVAADPTAPILIYNHIGYGAIEGSSKMTLSAETAALINQYPQIVWFTGHTHYASQDPLMIQQESFTNIQLPTSGSKWWWYYSTNPTTASYPSAYATEANQGLILTISDTDVIYAERYDFGTKETIGQKWRIDIPAILRSKENFTYRVDERIAQAKAPEFAADAKMTVETTATSASFQVPLATINDAVSDNMVEFYTIIVTDPNGDIVYTEKKLSEYYRASRQTPYITFEASGLKPETDYQVYVRADSIFGKSSDALQTTITTKESRDPREYLTEILNVDYSNGVVTDKKGHTVTTLGTPTLENGMATFAGNSAYQYTLNAADKTAMTSTLTIETVLAVNGFFKSGEATNSWGTYDALISNVEAGGFGLNYVHSSGSKSQLELLTYYNNEEGQRVSVSVAATIERKEEIHVVATIGNGWSSLYIDGALVAKKEFTGNIAHSTATNPNYLLVGADTNGWGGYQCSSSCSVESVRLYAEAVDAGEAGLLYQNSLAADDPDSLNSILDVDYSTGSNADANGHAVTTYGTAPTYTGGNAVFTDGAYRYTLTDADYEKLVKAATMETVLTINGETDNTWSGLFSNLSGGGLGLIYRHENNGTKPGHLNFQFYVNGAYRNLYYDIAVGEEVHIVATYDGTVANLYINGERIGSLEITGTIRDHGGRWMMVGADYGSATNPAEARAKASIAMVNLYSDAASYDQVQAMYQAAKTAHMGG